MDSKDFKLTLTLAEVEYIGKILGDRPFNEVCLLLEKLRKQIGEQ